MQITFSNPTYLFLLLAIPLVVFLHFFTLGSSKKQVLKFANFDAIGRIKGIDFFSRNIFVLFISSLVLFFIVLSLAGITLHTVREASSFSFVIVIDSSRSMGADDIAPSRLDAAKETAINFIEYSPVSSKIGILSFSGNSIIEAEVGTNKEEIKNAVKSINNGVVEGTDLYEAVITSLNLLVKDENKAIILLSDGQINIRGIEEAIDYANENNAMIHSIAIGTEEGGRTVYGLSKVDIDALKAISYNTGGEFFIASDKGGISSSFDKILKITRRNVSLPLSSYLMMAVIFLFILDYFLICTRYR